MSHPEDLILGTNLTPEDRDPEAPDADAFEQATYADPGETPPAMSGDIEAPEWDAYEQSQLVQLEDDYR